MGDRIQMEKIKNLSLRATIIFYVAIVLVTSFILGVSLAKFASDTQQTIWFKYTDKDAYYDSIKNETGNNYLTLIPRISTNHMSKQDAMIVELCDLIDSWSILIISLSGCIVTVFLFYRIKIKIPLEKLSRASKEISENNLNFELKYDVHDEMGELCKKFEKMRQELVSNKKKMWNMIEDERILRAAIAHDIRTPVAITKGNLEILQEFLPQHMLSENKVIQLIDGSMNHVYRLEHFMNVMHQLNSIADIELTYNKINFRVLEYKIRDICEKLCSKSNIEYEFYAGADGSIIVDEMIIQEVEDNILVNALRFAKSKIEVTMAVKNEYLYITIEDDGDGFKEAPQKLVRAYYKKTKEKGDIHYGLGIYICKVLCNRHGGDLLLNNKSEGGATVTATFKIK